MSENREEILADFQACTGIDDLGIAIMHLEEANWVLVDAVNRAMGQQEPVPGDAGVDPTSPFSPPDPVVIGPPVLQSSHQSSPEVEVVQPMPAPPSPPHMINIDDDSVMVSGPRAHPGVSIASDFMPLVNSTRSRMLELNVEYRENMIQLRVPDHETISTVKTLLQEKTGVPPCQQEIRGWQGNAPFPATDRRQLSEMNLPKENFLYLLTPEVPPILLNGENDQHIPADQNIKLIIIDEFHENKQYDLNFPGSHTVLQVKQQVSTVTDIPVFRQSWTGWPEDCNDELSLIQIGVESGSVLKVTSVRKHDGAGPSNNMPIVVDVDDSNNDEEVDITDDEYHDAEPMDDDDFFAQSDIVSRSGITPLLPDDFGDEALAGIKFGEEFGNRYGNPRPGFFPGSLDDALNDACNKPADERKMLAIYLHHDSSVLTNVFCTQVLCTEAVLSMLIESFTIWGWDLTYSSNKQRFLDMVSRHFGSVASSTVRNFGVEKLPLVILIAKMRGNMEIFQVIHGNTTLDEFMSSLMSANESYQSQLSVEKAEELERSSRNQMKEEQERAFQEAQIRDQEREVMIKEQEEEQKMQEQLAEAKRRSEIEAKEAAEAAAAAEQLQAASSLPPEPEPNCGQLLANIRFRTPSSQLARRFLGSDTLSTLLIYLRSEGFRPEEFKVITSFPRKDISNMDPASTLESLKLCPQETLTLEAIAKDDSDEE